MRRLGIVIIYLVFFAGFSHVVYAQSVVIRHSAPGSSSTYVYDTSTGRDAVVFDTPRLPARGTLYIQEPAGQQHVFSLEPGGSRTVILLPSSSDGDSD